MDWPIRYDFAESSSRTRAGPSRPRDRLRSTSERTRRYRHRGSEFDRNTSLASMDGLELAASPSFALAPARFRDFSRPLPIACVEKRGQSTSRKRAGRNTAGKPPTLFGTWQIVYGDDPLLHKRNFVLLPKGWLKISVPCTGTQHLLLFETKPGLSSVGLKQRFSLFNLRAGGKTR